jgi:hypothetical protein
VIISPQPWRIRHGRGAVAAVGLTLGFQTAVVLDAGAVDGVPFLVGVLPADIERLHDRVQHLAPDAVSRESTYRRFYALRYLHALDDPPLYRWCLQTLDAG